MTRAADMAARGRFRKNYIINGAAQIWQRGTSISIGAGTNTYTYDRFYMYQNGAAGSYTVTRQGGSPYWPRITYVSGTPTGAIRFAQIIEGIDAARLQGKTVTLSVWLRASANWNSNVTVKIVTGNAADEGGVSLENGAWTGIDGSSTATFTTFDTNLYLVTVTKTISSSVKEMAFKLEWPQGTLPATAWLDVIDVQLEEGSSPTAFEERSIGEELALCQRYFEKSFEPGTAPAQNAGTQHATRYGSNRGATASGHDNVASFQVAKRVTPTITLYNPSAANALVRDESSATDCGTSTATAKPHSFSVQATTSASTGVGNALAVCWTADAEL